MSLENFILTCEKDNESLRKDINYYKNYNKRLKKENQELRIQAISREAVANEYQEVIDKVKELLGNYKHYSTPSEKQNSDNENLVNKAFDLLKEVE